ncbi:hypothetical protein [Paenibacillus sp. MBLB4367]|uniref:hypothetical protein n=1 Tax=Paenibacillus sp. MBLB4367 TaxID=3384767 RepID=UPI0039083B06
MSKRVILGLILSSFLIAVSLIMMVYTYLYATTNRVGVIGDGKFHFESILTYVFTCISGILFLIFSLVQAYKEKKGKGGSE